MNKGIGPVASVPSDESEVSCLAGNGKSKYKNIENVVLYVKVRVLLYGQTSIVVEKVN